jgi:16S rRNA processing protein RimM
MNLPVYEHIGKVVATHGFKGVVEIAHDLKDHLQVKKWEAIMLSWNEGSHIPFFIEQVISAQPDFWLIKLEEIHSVEEARTYLNSQVFAPPHTTSQVKKKDESLALLGFEIQDQNIGPLGKITDVFKNTMQDLVAIDYKGKELLIPIVNDIIKKVDGVNKIIITSLPDGYINTFIDED